MIDIKKVKMTDEFGKYFYDTFETEENYELLVKHIGFLKFITELVIDRKSQKIDDKFTCGTMYKIYKKWCIINNSFVIFPKEIKTHILTKKEFEKTLSIWNIGEKIKTNNGNIYYKDITIDAEALNKIFMEKRLYL